MYSKFNIVFGITFLICIVRGQDDFFSDICYTPSQEEGQCISLDNCEELKPLVKKSKEKLKEYHCGEWMGTVPKVCCPSTTPNRVSTNTTSATPSVIPGIPANACVTVDDTIGSCLPLVNCSYIYKKVAEKTRENLDYFQRSRCEGQNNDVCCDIKMNPTLEFKSEDAACTESAFPAKRTSQCCGLESFSGNKIINGKEAAIDQYPWLALLEYTRPYLCGGALISNKYVLTAAHCVLNKSNKRRGVTAVVLGEFNRTNVGRDCVQVEGGGVDCTLDPERILVESAIAHPEYDTHRIIQFANDIALLRLVRMVTFTDFIKPICLPSSDITKTLTIGTRLYVAGWGAVNETRPSSEVKLYTSLPFVSQERCQSAFNTNIGSIVWDQQMCAGGEIGKDTCKGDSGGPLMYEDGNIHEVVGVISFGLLQCGLKRPSVYTKVYDYLPWIDATIKA